MIFRSFCAFIWFRNIGKMLLQMTSGFLQLESTIYSLTPKNILHKKHEVLSVFITLTNNFKFRHNLILFILQKDTLLPLATSPLLITKTTKIIPVNQMSHFWKILNVNTTYYFTSSLQHFHCFTFTIFLFSIFQIEIETLSVL
jgi:hypothetical protein